jgi:phosphonate transport system substrate-binding protein
LNVVASVVNARLHRACWLLAAGACLLLGAPAAQAAGAEISLGIEPLLSARTLATSFQSFRDYLGEKSGSKVVLDTAPNYEKFLQQLLAGEFDIAFVGPHSSLLAAQKAAYSGLFKCEGSMQAVLIVDRNGPYQKAQDLRGKQVALPDPHTLGAMLGAEMFRPPQVAAAVDVSFKYNDFSNTAALMLLRGDAAAAVVIQSALKIMSPEIQNNVRVLAESKAVPHMVIIVHQRVNAEKRQKLHDAILEFVRMTDPRRNMFVQSCRPSDKLLSEQEAKQLGPYVDELKRRLGQ